MQESPNQSSGETKQTPEEKLNIMAQNAKDQAGANEFMQPGRKKRGPKPGSHHKPKGGASVGGQSVAPGGTSGAGSAAPQVDPIAELMPLTNGLASFYSQFLVQIAEDERAKLNAEKHQLIAHTSAVCLNQYMPGVLGKHASAIVLVVTLAETGFVAYRLRQENLARLKDEARRRKGETIVNPESANGAHPPKGQGQNLNPNPFQQ